jgi:hypothetical protein
VTDNGSSNEQIWNANGTMLRIMDAGTGSSLIYGFNSATGQCTTANQNSKAPAGAVWSPTNPNVDYTLNGTTVVRRTFDYTQPLNAPTSVPVFDVHSCPGLSALKPTWSAPLTLNEEGNTFVTAFSDRGGQDTGEYIVGFQTSRGCQVWNTLKGTVTADGFGQSGKISTFYPLTVHNVTEGPGGVAVVSQGFTCTGCPKQSGPFLWQAGTLTADLTQTAVGGHETMGYSHYLNLVNSPAVDARIWDLPGKVTPITSADGVDFPASVSTHLAWGNVDPADSYPFSATSTMPLSEPFTIKAPLEQELWGADPATGTFLRLAPTMSSGHGNVFNFRTQYAIESMSPTGCIAWSSDWMGTLGNTDGNTASCKLGSNPPMACRSDVFVTCPR